MGKTSTIPTLAALALATNSANAVTIFAADFQGTAVDQAAGAVTLGNLNNGTFIGSWSGDTAISVLDTDVANRGALIERDDVDLTATFDVSGVLADGVTVSYVATVARVSNGIRTAVMRGLASDGTVLFALGIEGDNQTTDTGKLVYYNSAFTTTTTIGDSDLFEQGSTTVYDDGIMETIRLELTTNSFDVYINNVLAANGENIAYFGPRPTSIGSTSSPTTTAALGTTTSTCSRSPNPPLPDWRPSACSRLLAGAGAHRAAIAIQTHHGAPFHRGAPFSCRSNWGGLNGA